MLTVTHKPPKYVAIQWTGDNNQEFSDNLTDVTPVVSGDSLILLSGGSNVTLVKDSWIVAPIGQRTIGVAQVLSNDDYASQYTPIS